MGATTLIATGSLAVVDWRCDARAHDRPFTEVHDAVSVSYVRAGSFGVTSRGGEHRFVAGAVFVGWPGDEYMCTHEHVCGDIPTSRSSGSGTCRTSCARSIALRACRRCDSGAWAHATARSSKNGCEAGGMLDRGGRTWTAWRS
jgi:hypothetical protein